MKTIPSYSKIMTLGSAYTQDALTGPVIVQEKIDGSFFKFGINEDGELLMSSKGKEMSEHSHENMFSHAVNHIAERFKSSPQTGRDTYLFCEYLQKPKHNTLAYSNVPKNNLVLFDVQCCGCWVTDHEELERYAGYWDIDVIPELYTGECTKEKLKELLKTPSYLGNETIEGMVIKNFGQKIELYGNVFPVFTKFVREDFKERNGGTWKNSNPNKKESIDEWIGGFKTEARWRKAYEYLRDTGELEQQPRDIAKLVARIQQDIEEEEQDNIKEELYRRHIPSIKRVAINGSQQWYKDLLVSMLTNTK